MNVEDSCKDETCCVNNMFDGASCVKESIFLMYLRHILRNNTALTSYLLKEDADNEQSYEVVTDFTNLSMKEVVQLSPFICLERHQQWSNGDTLCICDTSAFQMLEKYIVFLMDANFSCGTLKNCLVVCNGLTFFIWKMIKNCTSSEMENAHPSFEKVWFQCPKQFVKYLHVLAELHLNLLSQSFSWSEVMLGRDEYLDLSFCQPKKIPVHMFFQDCEHFSFLTENPLSRIHDKTSLVEKFSSDIQMFLEISADTICDNAIYQRVFKNYMDCVCSSIVCQCVGKQDTIVARMGLNESNTEHPLHESCGLHSDSIEVFDMDLTNIKNELSEQHKHITEEHTVDTYCSTAGTLDQEIAQNQSNMLEKRGEMYLIAKSFSDLFKRHGLGPSILVRCPCCMWFRKSSASRLKELLDHIKQFHVKNEVHHLGFIHKKYQCLFRYMNKKVSQRLCQSSMIKVTKSFM